MLISTRRRRARLAVSVVPALLASPLAILPETGHAQDPATLAAGAAAVTAVVTVINGASSWINDQFDDVAAVAVGAAFGKHGGLVNEQKEVGWATAFAYGPAEDSHGRGAGIASAQEGIFGQWSGAKMTAVPIAWTKPLHALPDEHNARGFAAASIDGNVSARTQVAVQPLLAFAPPDEEPDLDQCAVPDGPGAVCFDDSWWNHVPGGASDGQVWLSVAIPTEELTFSLSQSGDDMASTLWNLDFSVDNVPVFSSSVRTDTVSGIEVSGLSGVAGFGISDFLMSSVGGTTTYSLVPNTVVGTESYHITDILLTTLAGEDDVYEFALTGENESEATASIAAVIPLPGAFWLLGTGVVFAGLWRRVGRA